MFPIINFQAHWHPGNNACGIELRLQGGQEVRIVPDSPQEFIALLAILNGPSPHMNAAGHILCSR